MVAVAMPVVSSGALVDEIDAQVAAHPANLPENSNKFYEDSAVPRGCPTDRFVLQGPRPYTGGFNNMLMSFQGSLLLARATNRTYVVPAGRNDRYNQKQGEFRFKDVVDLEEMKRVWPCFVDSNKPWGVAAQTAYVDQPHAAAAARGARRGRRGLLVANATLGLDWPLSSSSSSSSSWFRRRHRQLQAASKTYTGTGVYAAKNDYRPKPGTIATSAPIRYSGGPMPGVTIDLLKTHFNGDDIRQAHIAQVGGSAWSGIMTFCPTTVEDEQFWRHVKPSKLIADEVAAFQKAKGLVPGEYVAVHTRWLEGKCPGRAKNYYVKGVAKQLAAMCNNNIKLTASIAKAKGLTGAKIFLASDRQRLDNDKTFHGAGAISYDKGNNKDRYYGAGTQFVKGYAGKVVFEPLVDMFTLVDAKLFVGNMISTFSTNTASLRAALGRESVLAWPEPKTTKTFWECERAHFWCGPELKEWSSAGHTKRHGSC